MVFGRLLGKRPRLETAAQSAFESISEAARRPEFYERGFVPDTFDGRFELITLHAALYMRRARASGEDGKDLAQAIFDRLFKSFDYALRESGTGDLSVGKKIRKLGEAFYGRARAYDDALDLKDQGEMSAALLRNGLATNARALPMAEHVFASVAALDALSDDQLLRGTADWAPPPV